MTVLTCESFLFLQEFKFWPVAAQCCGIFLIFTVRSDTLTVPRCPELSNVAATYISYTATIASDSKYSILKKPTVFPQFNVCVKGRNERELWYKSFHNHSCYPAYYQKMKYASNKTLWECHESSSVCITLGDKDNMVRHYDRSGFIHL